MDRRHFLVGAAGVIGVGAAGAIAAETEQIPLTRPRPAVYLVPGYRSDLAHYRGRPASESPELRRQFPAGYEGPATLITRIDEADGSARRALMPIQAHAITVRSGGGLAVWNSMQGKTLLTFDPTSLELGSVSGFAGEEIVGGGHAVFTPDGRQVILTERKQRDAYSGRPADHYGQITIRDPETLQTLEVFSTHGMSPHDLALFADGKHVAIANYGSFVANGGWRPLVQEPCLTILELASGRLVEKLRPPDTTAELRHLAASRFDRLAAVLVRRGALEEEEALLTDRSEVYEADASSFDEGVYLPGPLIRFDATVRPVMATLASPRDELLARQAQSMVYDAEADEVIVTFTSSHAVGVFDGARGQVKRMIRTDGLGLRYPRGVALHPDGIHYAVSGSWRDLFLFRRGTHEVDAGRRIHAVLFEHSHLSIS
ncbi:MAG TPA: DUF1513 domain-containing protein [Alphaproteobacteria bacterium]|nr:DUF1513 domain-containing protein [Alphaproteobacteria bacterium]